MAIDMETATLFTVGFANGVPTGALLLVSDQPMISEGVKTQKSDKMVSEKFSRMHMDIGIDALQEIIDHRESVKHLKF
jgi:AMP nucleosidase